MICWWWRQTFLEWRGLRTHQNGGCDRFICKGWFTRTTQAFKLILISISASISTSTSASTSMIVLASSRFTRVYAYACAYVVLQTSNYFTADLVSHGISCKTFHCASSKFQLLHCWPCQSRYQNAMKACKTFHYASSKTWEACFKTKLSRFKYLPYQS